MFIPIWFFACLEIFKNMQKNKNSHGFSLVGVIVAIGILGLVMKFLISMLGDSSKFSKTMELKNDKQLLRLILTDRVSCTDTLKPYGNPPLCNGPIKVYDSAGRTLLEAAGTKFGHWTIRASCEVNAGSTDLMFRVARPNGAGGFFKDPTSGEVYSWNHKRAALFPAGLSICSSHFSPTPTFKGNILQLKELKVNLNSSSASCNQCIINSSCSCVQRNTPNLSQEVVASAEKFTLKGNRLRTSVTTNMRVRGENMYGLVSMKVYANGNPVYPKGTQWAPIHLLRGVVSNQSIQDIGFYQKVIPDIQPGSTIEIKFAYTTQGDESGDYSYLYSNPFKVSVEDWE